MNPAMFRMAKSCEQETEPDGASAVKAHDGMSATKPAGAPTTKELRKFHDLLVERYYERMPDDRNVLFKMKELWFYLIQSFEGAEKYGKKIRKAQKLWDYKEAVDRLFEECPLRPITE